MEQNLTSLTDLSSNNGTTPFEVYSLTFVVPETSLLFCIIQRLFKIENRLLAIVEARMMSLFLLVAVTILSDHVTSFLLVMVTLFLMIFNIYISRMKHLNISYRKLNNFLDTPIPPSFDLNHKIVEFYRGHLLLATCISILAVDFAFFPRKFSKTDMYGWSVMDAGVGSFVFVHGLCSRHEHGKIRKSLKSSIPLFILGFARLIATTVVSYHQVVSEYGIHWNFFFTLAFTKVITSLVFLIWPRINAGIAAIVIMTLHQWLISKWDITDFILNSNRDNILSANKEGIISLLGFVAIYFEGAQLNQLVWRERNKIRDYVVLFFHLCAIGITGWIIMYIFHFSIQPTSRRMANLSYCIWVVSLTTLQLAVHTAEILIKVAMCKDIEISSENILWSAVNYNGLFYFLLANVLTGLVNLATDTRNVSTLASFFIMLCYLSILSGVVFKLKEMSIKCKYW